MHHPTAIIEPGAELGKDVDVGPFATIMKGAQIGDGCSIGPNAVIFGSVRMGQRTRVHTGAILGDVPQDLGFSGCASYVRIGDNCTIREGVTIHRATAENAETVVGDSCYLMGFSHVGHDVKMGNHVILCNGSGVAGHVVVEDRVFMSGNAGVHQFVRVGRLAMLGLGCMISKDVPPYFTMRGSSLNSPVGVNVVGMRRAGIDSQGRQDVKEAYRLLCRSHLNTGDAIEKIRELFPEGPAAEFPRFAERSKRGLCVRAGE